MDEAWIVALSRADGQAPKLAKAVAQPDELSGYQGGLWHPRHFKLFEIQVEAEQEAAILNRWAEDPNRYRPYRVLVEVQP